MARWFLLCVLHNFVPLMNLDPNVIGESKGAPGTRTPSFIFRQFVAKVYSKKYVFEPKSGDWPPPRLGNPGSTIECVHLIGETSFDVFTNNTNLLISSGSRTFQTGMLTLERVR